MIKVLILAYDFPPYVSVGGQRPYSWYKYFKNFGVEPIVITRQWSNAYGNALDFVAPSESLRLEVEQNEWGTLLRTPFRPTWSHRLLLKYGPKRFRRVRSVFTGALAFLQFYLPVGSQREMYRAGHAFLKNNHVDFIIATGEPFVLFHYARKLSKKFDIPWLADYRDPWSNQFERNSLILLFAWQKRVERRIVSHACHAITVSAFTKEKIKVTVPKLSLTVIPNGFDEAVLQKVTVPKQRTDCLSIAYVGTLYDWHPLDYFLSLLNQYVVENKATISMNFYGVNQEEWILRHVNEVYPALTSMVLVHKKIPYEQLLPALAENHVMLLFNYYSFMGTKVFDYLAIKRKILLCFLDDPIAEALKRTAFPTHESENTDVSLQATLLEKTKGGIGVKDGLHLLEVLNQLQREFNQNGFVNADPIGLEAYTRKANVSQFAQVLKMLLADKKQLED